ncbi:MAG: ACT domain-containing protein [Candidatus Thorarchaeota archaeon]
MLTQISVQMPDRPGMLAKFTKMLNENNIVIQSITVSQIPGLVLFIVNKSDEFIKILEEKNYDYSTKEVIAVLLPDNPSSSEEIQKVAQVLGDNNVNIDFLYSTFLKKGPVLIIHVSDTDKAKEVLKSKRIYLYE